MTYLPYLVGFDTETTGVNVFEDRIVTASIVYVDPVGNIIDNYEWLVNPGIDIADGAAEVHGITTEHAKEFGADPAVSVYGVASTLAYFMSSGVPVVAYNGAFDFSLLEYEIQRHLSTSGYSGFSSFFTSRETPKMLIDPYVLDNSYDKYRPGGRTLTKTSEFYGISLENAHASYDDCLAAVGVARALWDRFERLQNAPMDDLWDKQVEWYAEQQNSLAEYFEKQGKTLDDPINTEWPIRRRIDSV